MITWFDPPYKGTNTSDGFEVVIHGAYVNPSTGFLVLICVSEEGVLHTVEAGSVAMDLRFKRGKGWFQIDLPSED